MVRAHRPILQAFRMPNIAPAIEDAPVSLLHARVLLARSLSVRNSELGKAATNRDDAIESRLKSQI
jgi:hypothetical protein